MRFRSPWNRCPIDAGRPSVWRLASVRILSGGFRKWKSRKIRPTEIRWLDDKLKMWKLKSISNTLDQASEPVLPVDIHTRSLAKCKHHAVHTLKVSLSKLKTKCHRCFLPQRAHSTDGTNEWRPPKSRKFKHAVVTFWLVWFCTLCSGKWPHSMCRFVESLALQSEIAKKFSRIWFRIWNSTSSTHIGQWSAAVWKRFFWSSCLPDLKATVAGPLYDASRIRRPILLDGRILEGTL